MSMVSVIVPVYNVEAYLNRCVDSILAQQFDDFDLILVDDGSPDSCGEICDRYARTDSRVHVIHQKNAGLSAARNAGIDWVLANSDSQWLTFIDSDDWIHPRMLEILLENAQKTGAGVSVCGYQETDGYMAEDLNDPGCRLWNPEDYFLTCNTNFVIACAKLYSRSCFREIRYPLGKLHEDEFTTYRILFRQPQIVVTDMPLYCYFQNASGITKSRWTPKRMDSLQAQREQLQFLKENGFIRAHDQVAVWYAGNLCRQKKAIKESSLPESEKKQCLSQVRSSIRDALRRYWRIYCRRCNLDIFFEFIPALGKVYRFLRRGHTG